MSYCRVCGVRPNDDGTERWIQLEEGSSMKVTIEYRPSKRQTLCTVCDEETPRKVGREAFDKRYWGTGKAADEVPEGTKKEFYSDYLTSNSTLEKYVESTTTKLYE